MKIIKTASGKQQIKISKSEWTSIGKKAGWGEGGKISDMSTRDVERGYENFVNREIDRMDEGDDGEEPEEPSSIVEQEDIADMKLLQAYYQKKYDETEGGTRHYWGGKSGMIDSQLAYVERDPTYKLRDSTLSVYRGYARKLRGGEEIK